ncbi:hypothetical protein BLOT_012192 [Blomia tropicalis]|nr:hypothetical protein BLOT_012189 [Blomia tropicalis]KAI2799981.1 hypothetical protein BLOT_012192 [Blomia tropicalis]
MGKKRKHQQTNNDEAIIETSETDSNFSPSKKQKNEECLAEEDIVHDWSHDDVVTLFNNIEAQLPQTDTIKSDRRLDQIDWELIKFKNFLPEECKDYAKSFIQKIRKYRTLSEVVSDAKFQLDNPNTDVKTGKVNYPDKPKKPTTAFFRYFIDQRWPNGGSRAACGSLKDYLWLSINALYNESSIPEITKRLFEGLFEELFK